MTTDPRPLPDPEQDNTRTADWYALAPRHSIGQPSESKLGTLRVKVQYREEHILAAEYYKPLADLLLSSLTVKDVRGSPVYIVSSTKHGAREGHIQYWG